MINSTKHLLLASVLILLFSNTFSQELLTLDQAIAIALKNNYSIQVATNNAMIAKNNNIPGNAGMMPQVGLSASGSEASNKTHQDYSSGLVVDKSNVHTDALAYGAALSWTIFDGFNMFVTKDKLKVFEAMGDINAKLAIETTVSAVISNYYDVVRQKALVKNIQDAIKIYEEKVTLAEKKFNLGSGSKLDFLQAKVDLNVQKTTLMKQNTAFANAKATLNQVMARNEETEYSVQDTITITYKPALLDLQKTTLQQNIALQLSEKNIQVSRLSLKQLEAQRYPTVGVGFGYAYSKTDNAAGFISLNQNVAIGPSFTVSYNLFNGSILNHNIRNARLTIDNSNFMYEDLKLQVASNLLKAYRNFQTDLEALQLIEENYLLAKETIDVALERYRLGASTAIDLSIAQQSYENADNAVILARYDAKIAETELLRLNGQLVKTR